MVRELATKPPCDGSSVQSELVERHLGGTAGLAHELGNAPGEEPGYLTGTFSGAKLCNGGEGQTFESGASAGATFERTHSPRAAPAHDARLPPWATCT